MKSESEVGSRSRKSVSEGEWRKVDGFSSVTKLYAVLIFMSRKLRL